MEATGIELFSLTFYNESDQKGQYYKKRFWWWMLINSYRSLLAAHKGVGPATYGISEPLDPE
jgi:hypothetical protein